ncbi:MAG: Nif3-like dinuclear metal center hexameric protein [Bacilli bacterium]|jgi:dinuclear metal center YbgI/SA1388 family protein|nr:Nif3-like dinuclear metal center hexameric protein [Bacilli bacterium]
MKLNEIFKTINLDYPFSLQEEWDCSGIQINKNEINSILVCLDVTTNVLKYALEKNIDLIISHHPLIFNSYIDSYDYIRDIYQSCYRSNISLLAMHTNFDNNHKGMNYEFYKKLNYNNYSFDDDIITFDCDNNIINKIKELKIPIRVYNNENIDIKKGCIILGAGGSFIEMVNKLNCNLFISSEFKHHEILYAKEHNILLVDVTHQCEMIFVDIIYNYLLNKFNNLEIYYYKDEYLIDD